MLAMRPGGPDAGAVVQNTTAVVDQLRALSNACEAILSTRMAGGLPELHSPLMSEGLKTAEIATEQALGQAAEVYESLQDVAKDLAEAVEVMRRGVPQSILDYANLFEPMTGLILKWLEEARLPGTHPDLIAAALDVIGQLVRQADQMAATVNQQSSAIAQIGGTLQKVHDELTSSIATLDQRWKEVAAWEGSEEGRQTLFLDRLMNLGQLGRSLAEQTIVMSINLNIAPGSAAASEMALSAITDARILWASFAQLLHQLAADLAKAGADLNVLIEEVWVQASQHEWSDLQAFAQNVVERG